MEYKTIQELYLAVGVAGAIIIVFLVIMLVIINNNLKSYNKILDKITNIDQLFENDSRFENILKSLAEVTNKIANSNELMVRMLEKSDYYNRDLQKKMDRNAEQNDKIYECLIKGRCKE